VPAVVHQQGIQAQILLLVAQAAAVVFLAVTALLEAQAQ
jgi:hypothetical protein